jgi:diguanylate cyclase (GGDEF)-like protein
MFKTLTRIISRESPETINALAMTIVFILGGIDYLTGPDFSFSIFYLLPIVFVTWYVRPAKGYALCAISFIIVLAVAIAENYESTHPVIILWNAVSPLIIFLFAVALLQSIQSHLYQEQAMSRTDALTKVLNARGFEEVATRTFLLATRHHRPTALAYIDIDDFKKVNDKQGHSEGDRVLQVVASTLGRSVRATDAVGRLGGDEFAILMPETSFKGAKSASNKIHQELLHAITHRGWPIGFSVGVAAFPAMPGSIDDALKVADQLMYRAKKSGKNHVVCELQPVHMPKDEILTLGPDTFIDEDGVPSPS